MKKILAIFIMTFLLFLLPLSANAKFKQKDYRIVEDPEGVFIIELNSELIKDRFMPYVVEGLETNADVFDNTGAKLVINAGFFDPKNKKTVSYVVIDSNTVLDPNDNENLMENKVLEPYMGKILNRTEFRIIKKDNGETVYDICPHEYSVKDDETLIHSVQAGPMLLPDLRLEEEFFVLKKDGKITSESASCLHKYARTGIGIKDNNVYLFIATRDNPMTLEELKDLTRKWGMEKSMAFDGGGSTSFNSKELSIISEKDNQARKLKSFLILK